ncbi:amidase family protein [Caballeronia sp. INDeC2]|uniref:amidase family protein n=1 Tax=Caballeronia sp. INDeC2 TaxID=2921747 RepID=UPI002027C6BC|nr:amidase family protein [Caballeronia sp. INDeC2]
MSTELWRLSAVELARLIATREISSVEAAESCLLRTRTVNPRINAVAEVLAASAMAAALEADAALARGERIGPLHGVPVTTKINVDQAGCATTNGVRAYRDAIAQSDSPPVANLRKAGAIIIGRTNTAEFAYRWFTDNALHGRTLNPYDPSRTPGGSSGGAAAAVAVGMGPIAHANDQGGSIRYPAYACGVTGLRPSLGRVPAFNPSLPKERPLGSIQLASVQGPIARHVADLRLALKALSAPDVRDVWWTPAPLNFDTPALGTKVAVCAELPGYRVDPAVTTAVRQAARWLEDAGYVVEETAPPPVRDAADLWLALSMTESRAGMLPTVQEFGGESIKRAFASFYRNAPELDLLGYVDALSRRSTLLRAWLAFLERHPLLLMPVSLQRPFPIDADQHGDAAMRELLDAQAPLIAPAILGLPGLSVPTGMTEGVPIGVQLVAGRYQEPLCLAAGEAIEQRASWNALVDLPA